MSREQLLEMFLKWKVAAVAWLCSKGVPPDEAEETVNEVWLSIEQHFKRGGEVKHAFSFLWTVLRNEFIRWIERRHRFGGPLDSAHDCGLPDSTSTSDARMDLDYYLVMYAADHPVQADKLRVFLLKSQVDMDVAANTIAIQKGRSPKDPNVIYAIKRDLSACLAKFAAWCRKDGLDIPDE